MCPATATVSPFLPDFHPATTRPPAAPAAPLPKQRKSRENEVDIRDHRRMVGSIKPDVKAILPEPRSVQKANSYQFALQWSLRLLLAGAMSAVLTGCVGALPVPTTSKVEYGQKVDHAQARFIQPGRTTRAEVIAALGTNHVAFPRTRSISYTWELRGGGGIWWFAVAAPQSAAADAGGWSGGWRGFFVAFDDQDVVRSAEFQQLSTRRSLDANMDRWAAHLPKPQPPAPALVR